MKKTIIFASVALATLFAFSSCQKETLENNYPENNVRVITATFENNGTKTELDTDDKTPLWGENDVIRVFGKNNDADSYQDITLAEGDIKSGGKSITFTTTLSGTLYAVYPASATTMTNCSGSIDFTIPANQDGTFASANICVAKSSTADGTNGDNLVFSNATSILEFSQGDGSDDVLRVAVTAANAIAGKLTATFGEDNKAQISTSNLNGKIIWTTAAATAQDKYYVAIAPVATGDVNFVYYTALTEAITAKVSKTLERNKIYELTIPTSGYSDSYVTIGNKKWAKYNLGATTVAGSYATCYGDLYEWGSVNTLYDGFPYTSATAGNFTGKWKDGKSNGYSWQTYCGGSSFNEWSTPPHDNTKLKAEYDVATVKLGTGWRMPTKDDFKALCEDCGISVTSFFNPNTASTAEGVSSKGIYYCSNYSSDDGIKGLLFYDGSNKLFFPAAGCGSGTSLYDAGSYGNYWSSSLCTDDTGLAYYLYFISSYVYPQSNYYRYYGFSVRPVSD